MASNDKQGREPGRQQSADIGPAGAARAQQGAEQGQRGTEQNYGAQRAGSQYGRSLQTRGGTQVAPWSNYGAYGGGPFSVMRRISDEMDRLFEGFGFGRDAFGGEPGWQSALTAGAQQGAALWSPHLEMFERDGKLIVTADLPGVRKEDVKVEVDQDAITLQGQRRQEQTSQEQGYYRSERSYGSFYRTIPLPRGRGSIDGERDFPRRRTRDRAAGTTKARQQPFAGDQGRARRRRRALERGRAGAKNGQPAAALTGAASLRKRLSYNKFRQTPILRRTGSGQNESHVGTTSRNVEAGFGLDATAALVPTFRRTEAHRRARETHRRANGRKTIKMTFLEPAINGRRKWTGRETGPFLFSAAGNGRRYYETDRDFESRSASRRIDSRGLRGGAGRRSVCVRVRPALLLRQQPGVLRYVAGLLPWLLLLRFPGDRRFISLWRPRSPLERWLMAAQLADAQ
jgi:HSP20 family protein